MVYITGDTHRDFRRVVEFCHRHNPEPGDILVILGDAGINYFGTKESPDDDFYCDRAIKRALSQLPLTFFCVHGNHEMRPESIASYETVSWQGATAYAEPAFPQLLFAKDGEIYELMGKRCLVIGGAYSVDKDYRLAQGLGWWADEQPSVEIKRRVEARLVACGWRVDIILSHTCPRHYIDLVVPFVYGGIDHGTERWLADIEKKLDYSCWYCGHFHVDKTIPGNARYGGGKIVFMHEDFKAL